MDGSDLLKLNSVLSVVDTFLNDLKLKKEVNSDWIGKLMASLGKATRKKGFAAQISMIFKTIIKKSIL